MNKLRNKLRDMKFKDIGGYSFEYKNTVIKQETDEKIGVFVSIDFWKDYIVMNTCEFLPSGRKVNDRMSVSKTPKEILEKLNIFLEKWNILI